MSNKESFHVQLRDVKGTRKSRALRASGLVPAVLYGHGQECVNLTVPVKEVDAMIRHGSRVVELSGGITETAFVKEVQWNAFGTDVLHLDLTRVNAKELVDVTVRVELRGDAPGTHQGGMVNHVLHELEMMCPASDIPEKIDLDINHLELDQSITAGEIDLPKGATLVTDKSAVIVQCSEVHAQPEETGVVDTSAEPEVIGRKESAEEEGSE
ncbi:MAG: 50S ribosomal protein L25 [Planctomycetales bacterium]|nr:50S ribosomal protein L25 [Planctomycetales bacterium]